MQPYVKTILTTVPDFFYINGVLQANHGVYNFSGAKAGVKVDDWRKKVEAGSNAGSPYNLRRLYVVEEQPANFTYESEYFNNVSWIPFVSTSVYGHPLSLQSYVADNMFGHVAGITAENEAQALGKIYAKIRNDQSGTNGLIFTGELRETVHMLRHPLSAAKALTDEYLDLLKLKRAEVILGVKQRRGWSKRFLTLKRLNTLRDAMAGTWLEYAFGMKPLISDVEDIVDAAIRLYTKPERKLRLRAKSKPTDSYLQTFDAHGDVGGLFYIRSDLFGFRHTRTSVQYVVGMKQRVAGPSEELLAYKARCFGFNIESFVPALYELAPWSFLIDYFSNLGTILESATTSTNELSWVCRTEKLVTTSEYTLQMGGRGDTSYRSSIVDGESTSSRKFQLITLNRSIPDMLPTFPPFILKMPGIDSTKWYNMAALLAQTKAFRF
jgi:hypothetical protein